MFLNTKKSTVTQVMNRPSLVRSRHQQQGSILLTSVFVMVVLSALAFVLMDNLRQEDSNLSLDVNRSRAFTAAHSGADWGLAQVLNRSGEMAAACVSAGQRLSPGNGLPNRTGFASCYVDVSCAVDGALENDEVEHRVVITAMAVCGTGSYLARQGIEVLAYE